MPIITSARVAKVQKKSRLRNAEKKLVTAGTRAAVTTVAIAASAPAIPTPMVRGPRGDSRYVIHAAIATAASDATTATCGFIGTCGGGATGLGSFTASSVIRVVTSRISPIAA